MTDPISDAIIRVKNAGDALKDSATFPFSELKMRIFSLLQKEGFVKSVSKKGKKTKQIEVEILFNGKYPRIQGVRRLSKPSRRIYKKVTDIRPVKNGYGMLVLSTPQGILSDTEAKRKKIGGEALFEIW